MESQSVLTIALLTFCLGYYLALFFGRSKPKEPKGVIVEIINHGITERRVHVEDGHTFAIVLNEEDSGDDWKCN